MTEDKTLFQQLVNNDQIDEMIADLEDLDTVVEDDEGVELVQHWELALSFDLDDVPRIVKELEELADADS